MSKREAFIESLVYNFGDDFKYIKKLLNYNGYRVTKTCKALILLKIKEYKKELIMNFSVKNKTFISNNGVFTAIGSGIYEVVLNPKTNLFSVTKGVVVCCNTSRDSFWNFRVRCEGNEVLEIRGV